jgi:hypothetical protein
VKRPLSKAQRADKLEELERLVLAALMLGQQLLADDLARLGRGEEARDVPQLSLAAHRLQLVHSWARAEVSR